MTAALVAEADQVSATLGGAPADRVRERPKILIVDDNEINRKVLRGILQKQRYDLVEAVDGADALQAAWRETPDLILLDIMMPIKDGYEVCAELKSDDRGRHIPIVFLSALADAGDKIKGLELGAADYITKPFDKGEVLARVRTQLKVQRLTAQVLRANAELMERQAELDEDLKAAAVIQRSLMPRRAPAVTGVAAAWRFLPCERIGGDIFNLHVLPDGSLAVYIADVSGHGVPAAMLTVAVAQSLSPEAGTIATPPPASAAVPPAAVLASLDRDYPLERFGKHFTACYGVFDAARGRFRYSAAGHPPPLLVRADGAVDRLEAGGTIIGLGHLVPYEEAAVALLAGDRVFFYTDGLTELVNGAGEMYGEERLCGTMRASRRESLEVACDHVLAAAVGFGQDQPREDDVTLLAIEFRGAGGGGPQ